MSYVTLQTQKKSFFGKIFPWLVCALGALFYIYEYVLRITPGVITVELMRFFGINALVVSNLAAFYYYAYTPMQLPVGVLMDRFGPRRLITIACLICAIGSFMFGETTSLTVASIGRFLVGFGSAFAFVGVLKLATIWLPPNRFALVTGLAAAMGAIGAAVGFVTIQKLINHIHWQDMIDITAVSGVILAAAIFFILKDRPKEEAAKYRHINWGSVIGGFVTVMKNKYIWVNGMIGCFLYLPAAVFAELWGKQYLVASHGYTSDQAVIGISFVFFGFALGGPIFGFISDILKNRRLPMAVGAVLSAAIFCAILYMPNLSINVINVLLFCFGIAYSAQAIVFAVGRELSPSHVSATAIAVTNMFVMLSGSIFETVVGEFLKLGWDHTVIDGVPNYSGLDFTHALTVIPILLISSLILIFFLKETHADVVNNDVEKDKVVTDDESMFQMR